MPKKVNENLDFPSLFQILSSEKTVLREKYGVVKIGIFGSFTKGTFTDKSDVDIAIELNSSNQFRSFFAVKHFLESKLHRKVDLGIESTLKSVIKDDILSGIKYV